MRKSILFIILFISLFTNCIITDVNATDELKTHNQQFKEEMVILPNKYTVIEDSKFVSRNAELVRKDIHVLNNGEESITYTRSKEAFENGKEVIYIESYYGDNNVLVSTYYVEDRYSIHKTYTNGELIKINTLVFGETALLSARETQESDSGWGYSLELSGDEMSYCCPQLLVNAGEYRRRNIEIYYDELPAVQQTFCERVDDQISAEERMARVAVGGAYGVVIDILGDVLGATLGDVDEALSYLESIFDTAEIASNLQSYSIEIAECNADLYYLFNLLVDYDHLD